MGNQTALDMDAHDLNRIESYAQIKHQLTAQDSLLLLTKVNMTRGARAALTEVAA